MSGELKRITYVEDEPDIRALAEMVLTRVGGFDVDLCASGQEALEKTPGFAPDLILLDVMMPGMHGPEVFRALRAKLALRETPVIFMTAKAQANERNAYRALGVAGVIPKPFELMSLPRSVRAIWDEVRVGKDA